MSHNSVLIASLLLCLGVTQVYSLFKGEYSDTDYYKQKISKLEQKLEEERLKYDIAVYRHESFRNEVAGVLPDYIKENSSQEKAYPMRRLASVVTYQENEVLDNNSAKQIFKSAKAEFKNKNYLVAQKKLSQFIEEHPYSQYIVEAFYLTSESFYLTQNYDRCIEVVSKMIQLFPENELTGYALLRSGKIYELRKRPQDSVDIYKTVLRSFPFRGVASKAGSELRAMGL